MEVREARGVSMPVPGFGTWQLEGDEARKMTEEALEMGYRHLDAAEMYGNEEEVGEGWRASGLDRTEIFITSKVLPGHYGPADFRVSAEGILERLQTDYLDLLLIHWPVFEGTTLDAAIERLNALHEEGLTRFIGVSNFTVRLLDQAWTATTYPLVVNQVEYHPFLDQSPLRQAMEERDMILTAYSPVAQGRTVRNPILKKIGEAYGKTGAQVSLRWLVQQGAVPLPRSSKPEHARDNLDIFDFELTTEEMEKIHGLHEPDGRILNPGGLAPEWD